MGRSIVVLGFALGAVALLGHDADMVSSPERRQASMALADQGSSALPGSNSLSPRLPATRTAEGAQRIDGPYTALIRQHLRDPRITTELVDHLPASDAVPSPLKFFGRIVGTPGELTYASEIHRYYQTLATASPRAELWTIGTSEEGRDIVALAIADADAIRSLDRYKSMLGALTDPRKTSDAQAAALIADARPIYYIVAGVHSPETGGPEMLIELAYRLIVDETPFFQNIRRNVIVVITPVIEVDGREKQVDTYYFNKKLARGVPKLPLVYWGKYVAHDNNRDGIGQYLRLTQAVTRLTLDWHPTVTHDLHEAQAYLYVSTGTGPYNDALDPIAISEWWTLAQNDVMEMAKRSVPGVWTYGFYDGWAPNYLFFIAQSHNAIGRFYEVQSYGPDPTEVRPRARALSREWYRPNPPLSFIRWGPRNNINIQQSTILLSLGHVATNRRLYLENYWLKNRRAVEKGRNGPVHAWVIPAGQKRKADAASAVNDLRRQGLEISRADSSFRAGSTQVEAGDYIVRGDQPYRTLADMYFSIQNYPPQNPLPYDDTGWTFQLLRNLRILPVTDPGILDQRMSLVVEDVRAAGGISGAGSVLVVEDTADNNLVTFRFRNPTVRMMASEHGFEIQTDEGRRRLPAGTLIVENANMAALEPQLRDLGLSGWALPAPGPAVKMHELDVPRIGYVHSWVRTQDEGWWRAAFDAFGVPYTYFADQKLRDGNLRAKYDVLVMPNIGGSAVSQVNGIARTGRRPLPYKKTEQTPNLGILDSSDDIRGGMGIEGLAELVKFVQQGGLLVTEASTATIFPEYGVTRSIAIEEPVGLLARGTILRSRISDPGSPIVYGYGRDDLPVYFNQAPVFATGDGRGQSVASPSETFGQNITPNAVPLPIVPLQAEPPASGERGSEQDRADRSRPRAEDLAALQLRAPAAGEGQPRVVLRLASDPRSLLLSGTLAGGHALADRAALLDLRLGAGHLVMFAIRPFWRWQTHGTFRLGFNAIMNWNDLDTFGARVP